MSTPAARAIVAALCRRSCSRTGGIPLPLIRRRNRWETPPGCHARPSGRWNCAEDRPRSRPRGRPARRRHVLTPPGRAPLDDLDPGGAVWWPYLMRDPRTRVGCDGFLRAGALLEAYL